MIWEKLIKSKEIFQVHRIIQVTLMTLCMIIICNQEQHANCDENVTTVNLNWESRLKKINNVKN